MHPRAEEFLERAAADHDLDLSAEEFPEGTKTAADAADALGCEVAQIASSIVFRIDGGVPGAAIEEYPGDVDGTPDGAGGSGVVVVITSGAHRVSEGLLADHLGVDAGAVSTAGPDLIKDVLGWSIGGVPPICHDAAVPVYIDESLLAFDTVWAAAGTPEAVFPVDPDRLQAVTGAPTVDVFE